MINRITLTGVGTAYVSVHGKEFPIVYNRNLEQTWKDFVETYGDEFKKTYGAELKSDGSILYIMPETSEGFYQTPYFSVTYETKSGNLTIKGDE